MMKICLRSVSRCFYLAALPFATAIALTGCGASSDDNPPFGDYPSAIAPPFPIPSISPIPVSSPSPVATPPAQRVTGTLNLATATGRIATAPFTPTTGDADSDVIVGIPRTYEFESREPVTAPNGKPVTYRRLRLSLPSGLAAGSEVRLGTSNNSILIGAFYDETQDNFNVRYDVRNGTDGGTVKLVSIVDNVYTLDVNIIFEGGRDQEFTMRGTVSIYIPPSQSILNDLDQLYNNR